MTFKKWPLFWVLWILPLQLQADAADFPFHVVPWNGHRAAISLTFEGTDPSPLDWAVPDLDGRKLRATFFLIANHINRKDDWRKIIQTGHEIGNGTLDRLAVSGLTLDQVKAQVSGAQNVLQKEFGIPVKTFFYPYGDITPDMENFVKQSHLLASSLKEKGDFLIKADLEPDWWALPSRAVRSGTTLAEYQHWVHETVEQGAWTIWSIQNFADERSAGISPMSQGVFDQALDLLQKQDLWIDTFLKVGAYFQAQRIFERGNVERIPDGFRKTWEVPDGFPIPMVLKLKKTDPQENGVNSPSTRIFQGGHQVEADRQGFFPIDFDQGEAIVKTRSKGE